MCHGSVVFFFFFLEINKLENKRHARLIVFLLHLFMSIRFPFFYRLAYLVFTVVVGDAVTPKLRLKTKISFSLSSGLLYNWTTRNTEEETRLVLFSF